MLALELGITKLAYVSASSVEKCSYLLIIKRRQWEVQICYMNIIWLSDFIYIYEWWQLQLMSTARTLTSLFLSRYILVECPYLPIMLYTPLQSSAISPATSSPVHVCTINTTDVVNLSPHNTSPTSLQSSPISSNKFFPCSCPSCTTTAMPLIRSPITQTLHPYNYLQSPLANYQNNPDELFLYFLSEISSVLPSQSSRHFPAKKYLITQAGRAMGPTAQYCPTNNRCYQVFPSVR